MFSVCSLMQAVLYTVMSHFTHWGTFAGCTFAARRFTDRKAMRGRFATFQGCSGFTALLFGDIWFCEMGGVSSERQPLLSWVDSMFLRMPRWRSFNIWIPNCLNCNSEAECCCYQEGAWCFFERSDRGGDVMSQRCQLLNGGTYRLSQTHQDQLVLLWTVKIKIRDTSPLLYSYFFAFQNIQIRK